MQPLPLASTAAATASSPRGWPLLRLGFRPFYLGAAAFAVLAIPLWVAVFLGYLPWPAPVAPLLWHAHEMLFGFALAVIVGFLLTAGKAWTGLDTPRGIWLGALFLVWLAARVAALTGPSILYAALDVVLLPLVAVALAVVLLRGGSRRNLVLPVILLLLALCNLDFHLTAMGLIAGSPLRALHASLALVVMIECVIAGRVLPAFTTNATPGLKLRASATLDRAALIVTALALALWVFEPLPAFTGLTAFALALAAVLHVARQWQWKPWVARGRPILWILHVAYGWLAIGFALLALAQIGWIGSSAGLHALAIGATAGLIIGMITRTARGHTGRPLRASKAEALAYALVMLAAVLRVGAALISPLWLADLMLAAAIPWSAAFAIYLAIYAPWLATTRLDGRDG
ncbi:MAG: NnrS family protein [Variovorax sp.]